MSVVIYFQGDDDWFKANWVFRRLCEDIRVRFHLCEEDDYKLRQAQALGGLILQNIRAGARERIMQMIKHTAMEVINDNADKFRGELDETGYRLYRNALPGLVQLIDKYENAKWPMEEP